MGLLDAITALVRAGYPEETARKIASGELPMDTASRMARAADQGFNAKHYHGTRADILEFQPSAQGMQGPGIYSSSNPSVASGYPQGGQGALRGGENVIPIMLRGGVDHLSDVADRYPSTRISDLPSIYPALREEGITGLESGTDRVTFDPRDIRSYFSAAFDPDYTGPNILGGAALPVAAGLLAAGQSEDADAGFITKGGKTLLEAWHGSPHKFDKFSMDYIGTGEGAQAYGHGLYFADREDVAKAYRDALTRPRFEVAGKPVDSPYNADIQKTFSEEIDEAFQEQADSWADLFVLQADAVGKSVDPDDLSDWVEAVRTGKDSNFPIEKLKALGSVEDDIGMSLNDVYDIRTEVEDSFNYVMGNLSQIDNPDMSDYITQDIRPQTRHIYDQYIRDKIKFVEPEGALYRTEIDVPPESLLDWDKPLSEQSEAVRSAIQDIASNGDARFSDKQIEVLNDYLQSSPDLVDGAAVTGILGDPIYGSGDKSLVSGALSDRGIKGIKYLDGDSRAGGDGTSNYVIFDDSLINIAERGNADPRLLAGTAAGTAGLLAAAPSFKDGFVDPIMGLLEAMEMPASGIHGLTRVAYGLLSGEDLDTALNRGADIVNMGVDASSKLFGDEVLRRTGSPGLATSGYMGGLLADPLGFVF